MKVYVVTSGEYSDYHICGVTLDKPLAERWAEVEQGSAEEYETDEAFVDTHQGLLSYTVVMDIEGNSSCSRSIGNYEREDQPYSTYENRRMAFYVWAKHDTHAVKIANERRIQRIASGTWETDWNVWKKRQADERTHEN